MLKKIQKFIFNLYDSIFSRTIFFKWNRFLYNLSIRGLGIMTNPIKTEHYLLKRILSGQGKKVVFDIGANVGHYAEEVKKINSSTEIFAFEPNPRTFKYLEEVARRLHFQAFPLGCGSEKSSAKIYDYENEDGKGNEHASLYRDVIESVHGRKSTEFDIQITTLDSFLTDQKIDRIDLLKIDTEGHELSVLKGAVQSINSGKINVIQFEFNEMNIVSRVFLKDFINLLPNYRFYRMLKDGFISIDKYFAGYHEIFAFQNLIAVRKDSGFKP